MKIFGFEIIIRRQQQPPDRCLPTYREMLEKRLHQVIRGNYELLGQRVSDQVHELTAFQAGVLLADQPAGFLTMQAVHIFESDFGKLELRFPPLNACSFPS